MVQLAKISRFVIISVLLIFPSAMIKSRHMKRSDPYFCLENTDRKFLNIRPFFSNVTWVNESMPTFLECCADGNPSPTIHWLKDGQRISQGRFENETDSFPIYEEEAIAGRNQNLEISVTRSILHLDCPTNDTEGEYTCVVKNRCSEVSKSTMVRFHRNHSNSSECAGSLAARGGEPPRLFMYTYAKQLFEGSTAQLYCRASGDPTPNITWYYRGDNPFQNNSHGTIRVADNGDLVIANVSRDLHSGYYACQAENEFGVNSDWIPLDIHEN